jgi:hypothetical protein
VTAALVLPSSKVAVTAPSSHSTFPPLAMK